MIFPKNPVAGTIYPYGSSPPSGSFRVTSPFGYRDLNGDGDKLDFGEFHDAIDLGNKACGAPVFAAADGYVTGAGVDDFDGAHYVIVRHGNWRTHYWHLDAVLVQKGWTVKAGQQIGTVGRTGSTTACHLHFAVMEQTSTGVWKARDPWPLLLQNVTAWLPNPGTNIRKTAGSGSTPGGLFGSVVDAATDYIRRTDGVNLGPALAKRPFGGFVVGASYMVGGVAGNLWGMVKIDGAWRFVARPLLRTSAS